MFFNLNNTNCCCQSREVGPNTPILRVTGPMGPTGSGLQIDGSVNTFEELPTENLRNGLSYLVGMPYTASILHIYDEARRAWINHGTLQGDNGITPSIGENGNWWIRNQDTGMPSRGATGLSGATPYVGGNGNWWINGADIGIRAVGFDGEDGTTPEIGTNDHWFIGDFDTGVMARGTTGPIGPTGATGQTGARGPELVKVAHFVTLRNESFFMPDTGLEIGTNNRLPIKIKTADVAELFSVDSTNYTIQFREAGIYKISFIVTGYVKKLDVLFNPATDFATIGFKEVGSEVIVVSANIWSSEEAGQTIVGEGIVTVENPNTFFELINLRDVSFFLTAGNVARLTTASASACPAVSISITKLN